MKVYKFSLPNYAGKKHCIFSESSLDFLMEEIKLCEEGDIIHIKVAEMGQDEIDKLPEFKGW